MNSPKLRIKIAENPSTPANVLEKIKKKLF